MHPARWAAWASCASTHRASPQRSSRKPVLRGVAAAQLRRRDVILVSYEVLAKEVHALAVASTHATSCKWMRGVILDEVQYGKSTRNAGKMARMIPTTNTGRFRHAARASRCRRRARPAHPPGRRSVVEAEGWKSSRKSSTAR